MRRTYYVQTDPTLVKGFPIFIGDSGEGSPKMADIDGDGVQLGDERIAARTVLWAAGVAASPLARDLGVPLDRAVLACASLQPVPGRMQRLVAVGQPLVAVDYAHTPDALEIGRAHV